MNFEKSNIVPELPELPVAKPMPDPGEKFVTTINDLFTLANKGRINTMTSANNVALQTQTPLTLTQSVQQNPNLTDKEKNDYLESIFLQNLSKNQSNMFSPTKVPLTEIEPYMETMDFEKLGYQPFADNDTRYAAERSTANSAYKILRKYATSTEVGALSIATPAAWVADKLFDSNMSVNLADRLAQWQTASEKYNKIFYTPEEQEASGMNPFATPTKFFDNLLPSVGFTVGNIGATWALGFVGGGLLGLAGEAGAGIAGAAESTAIGQKVIKTISNLKLGSYKELAALDDAIMTQAGLVEGTTQTAEAIAAAVGRKPGPLMNFATDFAKALPYSVYSGAAEGHVEAATAKQEFIENTIKQYKKDHNGATPDANEMSKINATASQIYDRALAWNTGILSLTNTLEIGALLSKFGLVGKLMDVKGFRTIGRAFNFSDVAFDATGAARKRTWKELITPGVVSSLIEAGGESFEEGMQYMISHGLQSWGTQKYLNPNSESVKKGAFDYIFNKENLTDEFYQNVYFGGLAGLAMGGFTKTVVNPARQYSIKRENGKIRIEKDPDLVQAKVDLLNMGKDMLKRGTSAKMWDAVDDKLNIYSENAKQLQEFLKTGDIFALKNVQFSDFYTWVASSMKAGGFELRVEQLRGLKKLKGDAFKDYFGLEDNADNRETVNKYLQKIEKEGKQIADDIESFNNIENIFKYTNKPESQLTEKEKDQNEKYENFENIKWEMGYRYSRIRDFDKRAGNILGEIEDKFSGTGLITSLKDIIFTPNGVESFKNRLKSEIQTLKDEASLYSEGGNIFKEDFTQKLREIKKREQLLEALDLTKKDYENILEKEVGENKYTEDQKAAILMRLNEAKDNHVLSIVTKYELEKIAAERDKTNTPFEIEYKGRKLSTIKDIQDSFMQEIGDLYLINKSKGIVLDKFNRLNTRKGIEEFMDQYISVKKQFEEGTSEKTKKEEEDKRLAKFNQEIRDILRSKGYPDTSKVGIKLRLFKKSDSKVKDLPDYLDRLDQDKKKAEDKIVETTKDDKTTFSTTFTALGKEYKLDAPTRDGLIAKINDRYNKTLEQNPDVLTEINGTVQAFSILDPKTKQLTKVYKIVNENGVNLFGKNFSPREVRDLLVSIEDFTHQYNIVSYEIMDKADFDKFDQKQRALQTTAQKLDKVETALTVTNDRIKTLMENPLLTDETVFNKVGDVSLTEVLQDGYYRVYGFGIELKRLNTQLDNIRKEQAEASKRYLEETGKTGFANTKTNKEFKARIQETINQINDITTQLEENKAKLEEFQKTNENHAQFYNDYRELTQQLIDLTKDKQLLEFYRDKINQTLEDLKSGKTIEGFSSIEELRELRNNLDRELNSITDRDIADLEKTLQDSLEKERQVRELTSVYSGMIFQHNKKIAQNNKQIKEAEEIIKTINELTTGEKKEIGAKRLRNQLLEAQNTIDDLNKQNLALQQEVDALNAKINDSIKALVSKNADALGLNESIIQSLDKIERVKNLFNEISKIYLEQSAAGEIKNLNDLKNGNYHSQRRHITSQGKVYDLENEPVKYNDDKRYKPNEVFQTTGRDIDSLEVFNQLSESELEEQYPQLEYYRFLSAFTPEYISENFSVLIITPQLASQLGKDNSAFADLYKHLQQQNAKNPNRDESKDLFTVIVDKKSGKLVKQNGKFLSGSLFKAETKFRLNDEGKLQHITERKVLDIYKTSDQYINDIEGLTEEDIARYLKDPNTLSKAIVYAEGLYKEEIDSLIEANNDKRVLVSDINDVTAGVFLRSDKEQSVTKVMGITKENADDFAIAVVTEGTDGKGSLIYIDKEGNPTVAATNVSLGTSAIVNRNTGEWIPVDNTKQEKGYEDVFGVMLFTLREAQRTGKKVLDVASRTKVSYGKLPNGKERYQLFVNNAGQRSGQDEIPLFQVLNALSHNKETVNFSKRWSVMTSLINWGHDRKNSKNSIYFDGKNQLNYYSFTSNSVVAIPMDKLVRLLDAFEKGKIDELSEQDQESLKDLIGTVQQKFRNISSQYALNTSWFNEATNKVENLPFLKPTYNKKTGAIEFVTYDSYLSYVLGLEKGAPIVKTNVVKVDGRTSVQKSLILKTDAQGVKLTTREMTSLPTTVKDVNTKTKTTQKEEETTKETTTSTKTGITGEDISTLVEDAKIIPKGEVGIFVNPSTGNIARTTRNNDEDQSVIQNSIIILREDVEANKDLLDLFNQIDSLFNELSKASEGSFEKELIRDSIKGRYYNLVRGLKNIALVNNSLTNKQAKEREDYNKDKDAKLIEGATVEVEGADTFTVEKFENTIAGSTVIMKSLTGGKPMVISVSTFLLGVKQGKVKIANNDEVKSTTPEVTSTAKPVTVTYNGKQYNVYEDGTIKELDNGKEFKADLTTDTAKDIKALYEKELSAPKEVKTEDQLPIEEVYKRLQDMGVYPSEDSLEYTVKFFIDYGGSSVEDAYNDIRRQYNEAAAKPSDSMVDLTLEKIVKDNNITKKC